MTESPSSQGGSVSVSCGSVDPAAERKLLPSTFVADVSVAGSGVGGRCAVREDPFSLAVLKATNLAKSIWTGGYFDVPTDDAVGWVVVAAGAVNFFVLFGVMGSFTVFLKPFQADPKFENNSVWVLNLAGSLQLSLARVFGLFVGSVVERLGSRRIIVMANVAQFLAYLCTSYVTSVSGLVGVYTALMVFALGGLLVPILTVASSYVSHRRNLAQGILNGGGGLGSAIFPLIIGRLLSVYGNDWRPVFRLCGAFSIISMLAAVFLPVRRDEVAATPVTSTRQFRRRNLYTSRAFAVLCASSFCVGFTVYGQNFMVLPFTLQFVETSTAVFVPFACGLASVAGGVAVGGLTDRFGLRRTQKALYALNALLCVLWATAVHGLGGVFALCPLSYFIRAVGQASLVTEMFRGHHLGEALAAVYLFIGIGGTVAPPILAAITESQGGNFRASLLMCAAVSVLNVGATWALPADPPQLYTDSAASATAPAMASPSGDRDINNVKKAVELDCVPSTSTFTTAAPAAAAVDDVTMALHSSFGIDCIASPMIAIVSTRLPRRNAPSF